MLIAFVSDSHRLTKAVDKPVDIVCLRIDRATHEQISHRKKFVLTSELRWKEGFGLRDRGPVTAR
jgi:hypothetical protein